MMQGDPRNGNQRPFYPQAPISSPPQSQQQAPRVQPYATFPYEPPQHKQQQQPQQYQQPPAQYAPVSQPPPSYGQPQIYGAPQQAYPSQPAPQQTYPSQPPPANVYGPYGAPQQANASMPTGPMQATPWQMGVSNPMAGFGNAMPAALNKIPQPSGLNPAIAFGLSLVAVAVALIFDAIFLRVDIPGVGGYAWYLTTALSFAGAGYGGMKWTRATKTVAMTAVGFAAVLYGAADIGLGLVVDHLTMGDAMTLAIQGIVIALVTGGGGVHRGARAKNA